MLARCYDPKHRAYKWYGARGIRVCKRWRDSFAAFLSDMGKKPKGMTLERRDNDGPYSPANCRWATWSDQQRNRRSNRIVLFRGKKMPLICAAELAGLPYKTVHARLTHGWPLNDALSKPVYSNEGSLMSLCKKAGVSYGMVSSRIALGWSVERALRERSQTGPHSLRARCIAAGLEYKAVHLRITRYGWTEKRAMSTPIRATKRKRTH